MAYSERSAFILNAAGRRTFCPALILEKGGATDCERAECGFRRDEDFQLRIAQMKTGYWGKRVEPPRKEERQGKTGVERLILKGARSF